MATPEIIMWIAVVLLGLGGGIRLTGVRNLTALALAVSWLAGQIYYLRTGNNLATGEYFKADVAVIAVIYAKTIWRVGARQYPILWQHIGALATEPTVCDRFIIAIFLLGSWPVYVLTLDPWLQYWLLYWFTLSQFVFAGLEAAIFWWHEHQLETDTRPTADIIPFTSRLGAEPILAFDTKIRGGGGVRC
jgi:hypothetical protein